MLSGSARIDPSSLGLESQHETWSYTVNFPKTRSIHDVTKDMKRSLVLEALRRAGGSKQRAAQLLRISRHALAYQMKSGRS